jgi:ribonuclease VapC
VIFVDASAIVAILTEEDEAATMIEAIEKVSERITSPIAVFEAALGICRKRHSSVSEAYKDILQFLTISDVKNVAIEPADAKTALDAFSRFGKGRGHSAQLNMGDCLAYAMAVSRTGALLFKGNDFDKTDVRLPIW